MDEDGSPNVSDVALAAAREMRLFDPTLGEEEIDAIARRIDGDRDAARSLNASPLSNGDEPVTRFMPDATRARP